MAAKDSRKFGRTEIPFAKLVFALLIFVSAIYLTAMAYSWLNQLNRSNLALKSPELHQEFERFMVKFGKKYDTEEERSKRFQIFAKYYQKLKDSNKSGGGSEQSSNTDLGISRFADHPDEELPRGGCSTD
ncbi:OLC1v1002426C1 [Oldenlandia corymbosa var. corymbosa]|uniref:OLC1v1002426C1 n=1 Tax=Oldenlandia corymbosa var. corymbosa TaxID=529605 RepID=A0AAV1D887_OLDCO|nr:OLC1v1002426C1 [Oldenlandia corymbosa var. corymbosa]